MHTAPTPFDEDAEVRQWTPLVHRVLRRFSRSALLFGPEDLLAEGMVGLLRGIRSYRSGVASKMTHYWNNVWWHLLRVVDLANKARRRLPTVSMEGLWEAADADGDRWEPCAPTDRRNEEAESRELADWLLGFVPERDGAILRALFGEDLMQHEVAAVHRVSTTRIGHLKERALRTVRYRAERARVA